MSQKQQFGGNWTVEKLDILSEYLNFYVTALKNTPFKKIYIDAFAGSGEIFLNKNNAIDGSIRLALKAKNKFDEYIFIEKNRKYVKELRKTLEIEFEDLENIVDIYNDDCNVVLKFLCNHIDWRKYRAVLFLDPYATEVEWDTLKYIAKTKAIDLWYLFPFSAVNRLMKKNGEIDRSWREVLNRMFGDTSWEHEFYKEDFQLDIWGNTSVYKDVSIDSLSRYLCDRLETLFPKAARPPRVLFNSKNSPLFLFCFAVANDNPRAIELALRVANYILNPNRKKN